MIFCYQDVGTSMATLYFFVFLCDLSIICDDDKTCIFRCCNVITTLEYTRQD